uniref:Uncharacterized protein n=1 Tax=Nothobranchius rachovii TaxID=451742 RepID=A0A1A8PIE2_9TELE
MVSKYDGGSVSLVLVDSKSGCGPRLVSEVVTGNMSEAEMRAAFQERAEVWSRYDNGSRSSMKNMSEKRMGSQVKTRPGGRDLEGKVQSGLENKEGPRGETRSGENHGGFIKECIPESFNRTEPEKRVGSVDQVLAEATTGPEKKVEQEAGAEANSRQLETGTDVEAKHHAGPTAEPQLEADVWIAAPPEVPPEPQVCGELGQQSQVEVTVAPETQTPDEAQIGPGVGDNPEAVPSAQTEHEPEDKAETTKPAKGSRSKSKSSKSCSRSRPGTATGMRPGALSPRQTKGLGDLESSGPPESIESTWPRRIMVRKRTVRQGGALHNLPILPPLPSVLSALEKRRPHQRPGSENPLSNITNSMVGRCSLKEPSHTEPGQGGGLVGRASLREQNLEHWRVCREQEETNRSRGREKQEEMSKKQEERKEMQEVVVVEDMKQDEAERRLEEKDQENTNKMKEEKKEPEPETRSGQEEDRRTKIQEATTERQRWDMEEVEAKLHPEDVEVEMEGG